MPRLQPFAAISLVALAAVIDLGTVATLRGEEAPVAAVASAAFDRSVAPLLASRCLGCHNTADHKGGLDLSSRAAAFKGGETGVAVVPGKLEESLLWEKVESGEMPPKQALNHPEQKILRDWISAGAAWGRDPIDPFRYTTTSRAGYDWWSLQPLHRTPAPAVRDAAWPRSDLDRFILARLETAGLRPAPPADRRTLVRRLSFDLTGLPPAPERVTAFLADESPRAYEDLVDEYLASPSYGERWARHWLDIVRFGESQGFERDKLRPNSWPYRDWVIQAFNRDLPYDEFVRLQIAGDVLHPEDPLAVVASGFLVAGPWDEPGNSQQSAAMKAIVRQDELEDIIGTTCQTFLGLTVNCARCHDHKFDPVSQREYYQIAAALGGVQHGERERLVSGAREQAQQRSQALATRLPELRVQLAAIEEPVRKSLLVHVGERPRPVVPDPIARWEFDDLRDQLGGLHGTLHGQARVENGRLLLTGDSYVTTEPLTKNLQAKTLEVWVSLANLEQRGGGAITVQTLDGNTFDSIVFGERETTKWVPGSNGFVRTVDVGGSPETAPPAQTVQMAIVYQPDQTITTYRNGILYGRPYKASGLVTFEAGKAQVAFGMRHGPPGGNKLLTGSIDRAQLYDRALTATEVAASAGVDAAPEIGPDDVLAALPPAARTQWDRLVQEISAIEAEQRLLGGGMTYSVISRQPDPARLLSRGNPADPREVVVPSGIAATSVAAADFGLPADATDADRRRKLAEWITDSANPLTARTIANRLWQFHFGTGIVETPNDLGFNGARPSHPELLDWLASELIESKWSLKALHRAIVCSATYRQGAQFNAEAEKIDADNRLMWRHAPRRLEAEAVRDAVLVAAGELNPQIGGPGYQDFTTYMRNTQFYDIEDRVGFEFNRRSVYRTWVRSGRNPFLDVLDCPDPSTTAPKRAVTTTPLQALALMNNSFLLRMSANCAARVLRDAGKEPGDQIELAFQLIYARAPDTAERESSRQFVTTYGLPALCRVLFNSNEFLYID